MISIPLGVLKAAALFMSTSELRRNISVIAVDHHEKRTRLRATDGAALIEVSCGGPRLGTYWDEEVLPFEAFRLSAAAVNAALNLGGDRRDGTVSLDPEAHEITVEGAALKCGEIEGEFPYTSAIVPDPSRSPVGEMIVAARLLHAVGEAVSFVANATSPVRIIGGTDDESPITAEYKDPEGVSLLITIMPMRSTP